MPYQLLTTEIVDSGVANLQDFPDSFCEYHLIMLKTIFLSIVIFFAAAAAFAQQPDFGAEQQRTEMKKLESLVGAWEGSGWIQQGKEKQTFSGAENIQRKLDGLALLVEGKFTDPQGKTIHQALAVISYDVKQKIYRFRTYLENASTTGDQVIKLLPDGWEWGFDVTGGAIKYTIKPTDTVWNEIGAFSRDGGKTWVKFFEMNLKKQK